MSHMRLELLMKSELFRQRKRKVLIIVDNQDIARVAHDLTPVKAYASDLRGGLVQRNGSPRAPIRIYRKNRGKERENDHLCAAAHDVGRSQHGRLDL